MWNRLTAFPDPPYLGGGPLAAVLIPLYEDRNGDVRVVLTKRPDTMPTHAGHLAYPGGRPDPGDTGPLDTALREAYEEVGIPPDDVEVLGYLHPVHTVSFKLMVVPVLGRLPRVPALVPSPREVAMVLEPRLEDLADEDRWRSERWNGHDVWFYDIDGEVLWGATAWMTRTMLGMET